MHDAKHPGDEIPPLPHSSTWFAHLEGNTSNRPQASTAARPTTQQRPNRARQHDPEEEEEVEDDDDIAIARERISLTCPLTLLPYQNPVTSSKCPHSFERQAIMDMISHSTVTALASTQPSSRGGVGGGNRSRRVKAVKCPVCSVMLTAEDLRTDLVLLRRVKRMEDLKRREREAEEDDEDLDDEIGARRRRRTKGGRKSGITVASEDGSDDDEEDEEDGEEESRRRKSIRVKTERARSRGLSLAPQQTQVMDEEED